MEIVIASDHGGYTLKEKIKKHLKEKALLVKDIGCYDEKSVDYPDYGIIVGEKVASGDFKRGIVVCSTGVGISIAANKVKGIRCSLVSDVETARLTREHNDANVLALGAKIVDHDLAIKILDIWLETKFEGERHENRVAKISKYENEK